MIDRKTELVFRSIDRMLSIILPPVDSPDKVLVVNGLSQKNVEHEALYCYRQIDPAGFLEFLGLRFRRVEQCMTNDGHVFFSTPADCQIAVDKLRQATVNSKPAFYVEKDPVDDCKFFYQVAYWDDANTDTKLCFADGLTVPFLSQFAIHAKRTGAHCIEGNYLAKGFELPPVVEDSKIMTYLLARIRCANGNQTKIAMSLRNSLQSVNTSSLHIACVIPCYKVSRQILTVLSQIGPVRSFEHFCC